LGVRVPLGLPFYHNRGSVMQKIIGYLNEVKSEMSKVSWPTKDELVQTTSLVVTFSLVLSVIIWGFDQVISKLVGFLLQ
jgi:preprotein translocase subunit SecE